MRTFAVLALFVAAAFAAPADPKDAVITKYESNNIGVEGYNFGVETSDGKTHQESAVLENVGTADEGISVRGSFSYPGPDGVFYTVTYIADKNGFQPSAAHLPA